uniref:Uncharacterized protein LOC111104321 isoform X1 n=1 Tax=Crassostrea virginica TaxID=6565 RepID=A0A8B8AUI6_CRAVI|nr:uncharacterized protein LOC111104321 isoform X1 [Crassostrea virginica]
MLFPETTAVVRQGQNLELTCHSNVSGGVYLFFTYDNAGKPVRYGIGGNDYKQCVNSSDQAFIDCDFKDPWRFKLTLLHPVNNQIIYCNRTLHRKVSTCNVTVVVRVPLSTLVLVTSGNAVNVGESTNFTCQTNYCDLPANITWYKGNTSISGTTHVTSTLNNNSESQVRTTSELWLSSVAPEDNCQEMYCTASNMEGETVESRRFKLNVTSSQVTIILAQCEVTAAQILLSIPTSVAFSHRSTPSTVSLQLSNRGDKFVNTNYEQLKQNVSHFQIYHVTDLQSDTGYFFRIVTFDGCGATYSESVACHTANRTNSITIYKETESNNNGPIIAGSLGGAVLFIAGGLLLFQCIQKHLDKSPPDQKDCHYVENAKTATTDHNYQDLNSTANTASNEIDERGEYLELPEQLHTNDTIYENDVASSDSTLESGVYLEVSSKDIAFNDNTGNEVRSSDHPRESGEYMELS